MHTFLEREVEQNPFVEWDESRPDEAGKAAQQQTPEPLQSSSPAADDFAGNDNTSSPAIEVADSQEAFESAAESVDRGL